MAEKTGQQPSGSPSDKPDDSAVVDQALTREDAPPASGTEHGSAPEAVAKPDSTPDAVTSALDRIRSGEAANVDDEPTAPTPPAEKPADPPKPAADAKPPKPADAPAKEAPEPDPLADWSPQEKEHTKGKVKERFRNLHKQFVAKDTELAGLTKKVTELEADATYGRAFKQIGEQHQVAHDFDALDDEQIAWSVKSQASALRAVQAVAAGKQPSANDLANLADLRQGLELVEERLGIAKKAPAIDTAAFNAALKDAQDLGDFEALQKLVGALPTEQQTTERQPAATPARHQEPAPRAVAPEPQANPWAASTRARLVRLGIPDGQVDAHYKEALLPEMRSALIRDYPRLNPDVAWSKLAESERTTLVLEAHATVQGRRRSPPPPASPTPPAGPIRTSARAPAPRAQQATGDVVQDAIAAVRTGRAGTSA